jgi:hypothetical protein
MIKRTIVMLSIALAIAAAARAQSGDPVSGKWGSDGTTMLDLSFDGKAGAVSGTAYWRANGESIRTDIKKGTYDPKTRALRLEGDGPRPDGTPRPYLIEGTVEGETITGKYSVGSDSGTFKFSRIKPAAGTRSPEEMDADFNAHKGDFDYLLGDWEFTSDSKEYGQFRGYWSAARLDEGQIIDEYRIVGDKGETYYLSKTLRNYNKAMGRWELISASNGNGLLDYGTGRKVGNEVQIEQKFGVASETPSTWKIRYYNIRPDAFSWTAARSADGGKRWEMEFQKIDARCIGRPSKIDPLNDPQ